MGDKDEGSAGVKAGLRDAEGERRAQLHVDESIARLVITPLDESAAEVMAQTLTAGNSRRNRNGSGSR